LCRGVAEPVDSRFAAADIALIQPSKMRSTTSRSLTAPLAMMLLVRVDGEPQRHQGVFAPPTSVVSWFWASPLVSGRLAKQLLQRVEQRLRVALSKVKTLMEADWPATDRAGRLRLRSIPCWTTVRGRSANWRGHRPYLHAGQNARFDNPPRLAVDLQEAEACARGGRRAGRRRRRILALVLILILPPVDVPLLPEIADCMLGASRRPASCGA